jgi:hypothetical protein
MRLLSLVCLARCAALPDIGVTYAATGRLNVLMAAESVRRLSTRYAHVHTLSADDHVKRTGNASYFLGDGDDAGRRRV